MNNPTPQIPQGSFLEQQKTKSKSNLLIAVLTILTLHVVLFGGMLIQGCKQQEKKTTLAQNDITNALPPLETNNLAPSTPPAETNLPVTAPPVVATPPTNLTPLITATPLPPVTPPPVTETTMAGTKEYTVGKGDSFYKIAKASGVSMNAIEKANPGVDSRKLKVGQIIQIPAAATKAPSAPGVAPTGSELMAADAGNLTVYTVKPGDTLTKITKKHGITLKALRAANNLKTDQLHVGQKLKLPAAKVASTPTPTAPAPIESAPGMATPPAAAIPAPGSARM